MYYTGLGDYVDRQGTYTFVDNVFGTPLNDNSLILGSGAVNQYELPLTKDSVNTVSDNSGRVNGKQLLALALFATILLVAARK